MMPGMRGMNPRQMKMAMKRLGITQEELEDVEEVIIKTASKDIVVRNAAVTAMDVQGQKTFQVMGDVSEVEKEGGGPKIPEEDIQLVASQANVSEEEAKAALQECDGNPAEAIIKLMGS